MRIRENNKVISAGYFIDELYENNLGIECDLKVLKKLLEYKDVLAEIECSINLNISHKALGSFAYRTSFSKTLKELKRKGIDVNIEITEQVLFENFKILEMARKELDFSIYVDDFGSGFSSFRLVLELAKRNILKGIKIDGSLIKNMEREKELLKVVSLISYMCKNFNVEAVAEYIENEEVMQILRAFEIEKGQGYFFSPPVSVERIKEVLKAFN